MKKYLLLPAFFIFNVSCHCTAQTLFQKTIDAGIIDYGHSVQQTADDGYIVSGTTFYNTIVWDLYLIKTNSNGDLTWAKSYDALSYLENNLVEQTNDGGYIIGGFNYGNLYFIRLNMSGDTLWAREYINYSLKYTTCNSIHQTPDSNYIIAGEIWDSGSIHSDVLLVKVNSAGDTLWTKVYGGIDRDEASSVQPTNDGGFIIAGYTKSFGADSADVYLIKTNGNGDTLWTKAFGGVLDDFGNSVKQTNDHGYVIAGSTSSFGAGGSDVYLIKTDSIGNILWSKTYGGTADDIGYSVEQTADGGYVISGSTTSFGIYGAYVIRTDHLGNLVWSKAIAGSDAKSVEQTIDGGYILTGSIYTTPVNVDILLVKTDSLGNAGCNEIDPATIIGSPATQVSGTLTQISPFTFTIIHLSPLVIGSIGNDSTFCTTVGVNEIETSSFIHVFPNPSAGKFIITFTEMIHTGVVEIYNVFGEKIYNELFHSSSKKEITLKNMAAGIYFVKVMDGEKQYTKKLVIEPE
ncbi:MAG: T9SS type A sorting domain-containing protein [Bacteroidetes bacterium]|nr:T9SS type A sorting domain-containing protein [Bacteroidota bacterium]